MRALVLALVLPSAPALGASFTPLGDLPGGSFDSVAYGISADGTTVVGASRIEFSDNPEAFRWTAADGMVGLGFLPNGGTYTFGSAVSADGSVVVGYGNGAGPGSRAFRWTEFGGVQDLGDVPGSGTANSVLAFGVSADGATVVGTGSPTSGAIPGRAVRWTATGGLSFLVNPLVEALVDPFGSTAYGVSADGAVIVGARQLSSDGPTAEAFRWTASGGMVGLGDLPGGVVQSGATAVSADGSIVVGYAEGVAGTEAFRWTQAGGMVGLGGLSGAAYGSRAEAISADGTVVVGYSGAEAVIWTEAQGMRRLFDVLVELGIDGLDGWLLQTANGISADGTKIVGQGRNPAGNTEAFLIDIAPVPIPGAAWLFASALGGLAWLRRRDVPS
jgi:probable HAF family extracellular repeat protein